MATKAGLLGLDDKFNQFSNDGKLKSMTNSNYFDLMAFNFFQDVSVIGFKYYFDQSRPKMRQILWGVLILVGVAIAIYQISDRILLFTSYPTSTNIDMTNADSLEFPAITICNENAARMSVAMKYGLVPLLTAVYPPLSRAAVTEDLSFDASSLPDFNRTKWEEVRRELAQTVQEAYYSCTFGEIRCAPETFRVVQTNLGTCFSIRASDYNFTVARAGAFHGLTLALFANQFDYLGTTSPSAGFRLLLHDPKEFPLMQEGAIKLSPGFVTSVSLTFNAISRQPPPYGTCSDEPGYYQSDCIMACEMLYVYDTCDCVFYFAKGFENLPTCTLYEMYQCATPATFTYTEKIISGVLKGCDCPPQCSSNQYQVAISQNSFSNRFADLSVNYSRVHDLDLPVKLTKGLLMENYVATQVFFQTMQYLSITTKPAYSFMGLLSDVGGALGLLLGATLYTFVEVFEFFYDAVKFWITTKMVAYYVKKNKRENKTSSRHKIVPVY